MKNDISASASHEDISQRARELWSNYGQPEGRDNEIWLEAERQLLGVDPLIEGNGKIAVSARDFDESTGQGKLPSRTTKKAAVAKAAPARGKR
ncbi:DUF2934 domain-containing protein [Rariglobus hedericola]|uniref:DUF2934 domain-containing protein n=1 Tax=Rariglobus hedericola TaxID=2597822 RepID=A0A556QLB1_9BACT|nr:DUF2934 domain-containing protein [Rariglobus hedericola]TSJ77426.1 DUF2934 domain-containing protein [Rariglobus hedericola]